LTSIPPAGAPQVVLIVDDDDDCRHIYRLAFERAGYSVVVATNGMEGVRLAREFEPHVILLDIAMPVMDGHSALKLLRASIATADLPVIAVTARSSIADVAEMLDGGFDEIVLKPAEPNQLITAVARVLSRDAQRAKAPRADQRSGV